MGIGNLDLLISKLISSNNALDRRHLCEKIVEYLVDYVRCRDDVKFDVNFNVKNKYENVLGYYDRRDNVLYIDFSFIENNDDFINNFVNFIDTLFHEMRHAVQKKELKDSRMSFSNLIMAIDMILGDIVDENGKSNYYNSNYDLLSFELDAKEMAYVDTLNVFKSYPELLKKYMENRQINRDNYARKNNYEYYEMIYLFINKINYLLKIDKSLIKIFDYYPVLMNFFDISRNGISIKSDRYFKKKLIQVEKENDSLQKKEVIYSIKMILYEKKVYEYLTKNNKFIDDNISYIIGDRPKR